MLLVCALGCATICSAKTEPKVRLMPAVITSFHADITFSPLERGLIDVAVSNLNQQTNGLLVYSVTYDLDMLSEQSQEEHAGDDVVLRTAVSSPLVQKMDEITGGQLLGLCYHDDERGGAITVFLVPERLKGQRMFVSVTMHEFLHADNIQHTPEDVRSVMYPHTSEGTPPTCINATDSKEICRVWSCNPETLNYCK